MFILNQRHEPKVYKTKKIILIIVHWSHMVRRKEQVLRCTKKFVFPWQKEENKRDYNNTVEIIIGKIIPPLGYFLSYSTKDQRRHEWMLKKNGFGRDIQGPFLHSV